MPKVSIIVPVFNGAEYLPQCLDSLVTQTLEDIEIICVDNCSTDESVSIISKYIKDKRIRLIQQESNKGQGDSVNKGWDAARGEYVTECDADDFVAGNAYETLYNRSQGADVVWGGWYDLDNGTLTKRGVGGSFSPFNPMTLEKGMRFRFLQYQPHILSAIYKREFLNDNGLRYRVGTVYEDLSLSFRIRTTADSYMLVNEPLYVYRRDNPNSGTATIKDSMSVLEQYEEMFRWNDLHKLNLDKELKTMRFYSCLWGASRIRGGEKEFWNEAQKYFKQDNLDGEFFFRESDYKYYCRARNREWI